MAVSQYLRGGGRDLLQGGDCLLGLAFLDDAQHRVDDDDDHDDDHIGKGLSGIERRDTGDDGGHDQNDDHGIRQLRKEPLEQCGLLALGQLIGAILGQTRRGFLRGKSLFSGAEVG